MLITKSWTSLVLAAKCKKAIEELSEHGDGSSDIGIAFVEAQEEIYHYLETDCFARFSRTHEFMKLKMALETPHGKIRKGRKPASFSNVDSESKNSTDGSFSETRDERNDDIEDLGTQTTKISVVREESAQMSKISRTGTDKSLTMAWKKKRTRKKRTRKEAKNQRRNQKQNKQTNKQTKQPNKQTKIEKNKRRKLFVFRKIKRK